MDKGKYINSTALIFRKYIFAYLIIGFVLLYASTAYASPGRHAKFALIAILVIFGIPTLVEILMFILHMLYRTKISKKLFIITSVIYIPIISIFLSWLLLTLLNELLNIRFNDENGIWLMLILLMTFAAYAFLKYLITEKKI